jgi:iron uptake system EfeUOB component EfeO/EfeM
VWNELVYKSVVIEKMITNRANDAFENYFNDLGNKDVDRASKQIKALSEPLRQLSAVREPNEPKTD